MPLGLPFNVIQYACLLKMIAQVTNLNPTTISYSINDPHIYVNEINGMKELIRREKKYDELSLLAKEELITMKNKLEKELVSLIRILINIRLWIVILGL